MSRYIQITIETSSPEESDILVARLSQAGFEGFEEEPQKLIAFIPESLYNIPDTERIVTEVKGKTNGTGVLYKTEIIEPRNWNAEWEKDYDPVIVESFCMVRAHFHKPVPGIKYDLLITPKMSFGTGHHATTYMMLSLMQETDIQHHHVLDFGTGTGVLAILASKMGAASVLAIDSDPICIENTLENRDLNHCEGIRVELRDSLSELGQFDVILANINLRVLLENMPFFRQHLTQKGVFIGSGILESDEGRMRARAALYGFKMEKRLTKDNWMSFSLGNP
jgi:ribosomal protein L11 methyltransferase